ncbi:MAG: trypsin-like peptidase domain-containing protein [Bacteroidota bacterium]|nr:trypsin-like peptidase domain-containing protein [Bacteroidota bacterium]
MRYLIYTLLLILSITACNNTGGEVKKVEWADKPVSEWPEIVFTNEIEFKDTTYSGLANSFLVNTGTDTLGVTCKHIFLVFQHEELPTIDLGENFISWKVYPKDKQDKYMVFGEMINENSDEMVDAFNTLKSRDWLLFEVDDIPAGFTPLRIRTKPVQEDEIIYCLGWPYKQKEGSPSLVKMQVFRNAGPYYYVNTLTENVDPAGRSGSPVIDANGYLVGIVSGAEGKLGVIGNVNYLDEFIK